MIIYLRNKEIDRNLWDTCLRNSGYIKPYAYSWYLDIMAPGWEALIDDEYDSVFPVPGFKKYGIKYITTPIFLQQLGAFSPDKPVERVVHEFIYYLPEFFRFVDLCVGQKINSAGYTVTERSNYILPLNRNYDEIWNSFSSDCRRNINLASQNSIVYTTEVKPKELINLFIENTGTGIKGIKQKDYERLETLMNHCLFNRKGRIIGVRSGGNTLVFGIFIVEIPGSKTLLFTANTMESREKRINYQIISELIKENESTSIILDFAGSSIPSVALFMESFGSLKQPYYRIYRNSLPFPIRLLK
ncbi:MAG: hypothetical protein ACUVTX_09690 [Bacteroidales bacterium]